MGTVHQLHEIVRCCLAGQPLDNGLARWLGGLLDDFLKRRVQTLEAAIGLTQGRGGIPWWLELAIRQRDSALRELAGRFLGDVSTHAQAKTIRILALRYAGTSWRADKTLRKVPQRYVGTPQEWLWQAFHSGARMPISERQLRSVLRPFASGLDASRKGAQQ